MTGSGVNSKRGLGTKNALPRLNPASRNALRQLMTRRLFILNFF
jgi:hypothetical protein